MALKIPFIGSGSSTTLTLTASGKQKAEEVSLDGAPFLILASLNEEGILSLKEIMERTHLSTKQLKDACKKLIASGYVRKVGE